MSDLRNDETIRTMLKLAQDYQRTIDACLTRAAQELDKPARDKTAVALANIIMREYEEDQPKRTTIKAQIIERLTKSRTGVNIWTLAREYKTTRDTIRFYIKDLRKSGYVIETIYKSRRPQYRITGKA